jgi:hypothetical protein
MAIDERRRRVLFDRWGEIKGVRADLLISLAETHRRAANEERAPQNYPFTKGQHLSQIHRVEPETLKRLVLRCRNEISRLAKKVGEAAPSLDAVIEGNRSHGYRLNPDSVRIVGITELTPPS